jgi:hypothetical protein
VKIQLFLFVVLLPQIGSADMVVTRCTKWTDAGPGVFNCSDDRSYGVGEAICSTIDTRMNGARNTGHPAKPIEIFCRVRFKDDPSACVNDGLPQTESCYKEYLKSKEAPTNKKQELPENVAK